MTFFLSPVLFVPGLALTFSAEEMGRLFVVGHQWVVVVGCVMVCMYTFGLHHYCFCRPFHVHNKPSLGANAALLFSALFGVFHPAQGTIVVPVQCVFTEARFMVLL